MHRFLIGTALTVALVAPASAAPPPPTAKPECPFERTRYPDKAEFHRLGELPPANQYLAVYRLIDGCRAETILARGLGANGRPTPPRRR